MLNKAKRLRSAWWLNEVETRLQSEVETRWLSEVETRWLSEVEVT